MRPMNIMQNLKEGENETKKCVICGKTYKGWGNDAWPVADGYCCDKCNNEKVLPARIAQMYGLKKESNLKEDDTEWNTYTVGVGFCGFLGVEEEYNISARSKQEAVCEALDNPGSEAEQDLSADDIVDNGDGSYTVTVSFAGNVGADNEYTVDAESEEEAEMLALEDAKSDLEIISIDGEEYTYGDEVESAGMVNEEDTVDEKSSKSNISHYYVIGENDFQELLKINGGAFADGYLEISVQEANELANKQGLNASNMGINSNE